MPVRESSLFFSAVISLGPVKPWRQPFYSTTVLRPDRGRMSVLSKQSRDSALCSFCLGVAGSVRMLELAFACEMKVFLLSLVPDPGEQSAMERGPRLITLRTYWRWAGRSISLSADRSMGLSRPSVARRNSFRT